MTTTRLPDQRPTSPILLVARTVWFEIIRREEYFTLLILMGIYLMFAIVVRLYGATDDYSLIFMFNLGLSASALLAAVLTILTASRQIPAELENRTLYPLLACPISRTDVFLGKFFAILVAGWFTLICFVAIVWCVSLRAPQQYLLMFAQAFVMQLLNLALLTALCLLSSLFLPRAATIVLIGGLFLCAAPVVGVLSVVFATTAWAPVARWLVGYIPPFGQLSLFTRFTDGGPPLPVGQFVLVAGYTIVATLAWLSLGNFIFERKNI